MYNDRLRKYFIHEQLELNKKLQRISCIEPNDQVGLEQQTEMEPHPYTWVSDTEL